MLAKRIWIVSKHPWVATLRSSKPEGDTSWFSLSKSSGEENCPTGEFIDVILGDNASFRRVGYVDVSSNATTITVSVLILGSYWRDMGVWMDDLEWF
jgi:hypothetical protein